MSKDAMAAQGPLDRGVRARVWIRRSSITGQATGVFDTQDVELRSERIEPMFSQSDIEAAVLAEREACAEICDSLKPYGVDKHAVEYAAEQIRARSNRY